jgi:hypothetical protein
LKIIDYLKNVKTYSSYSSAAIGIALLITLIPTARGHNIGYVDPNLYIGYATNLKWLVESGGFEYHATRLPFIGLIQLILSLSTQYFGYIYKLIAAFSIAFLCLKSSEVLQIPKRFAILVTTLISLSPLAISAYSWTMPNAFAAMFSCWLILFVLKETNRNIHLLVIGVMITTSFLLNAFGSSLVILLIITVHWLRKKSLRNFVYNYFIISLGISITAILFQLFWSFVLKLPGSFWKPHFDIILNRDLLVSSWAPISSPLSQGVTSYLILGVTLILLVVICKVQKITNLLIPIFALIVVYVFSWVTYFMKLNFSFNAFWYYYPYLPIFILTTLIAVKVILIINLNFLKHRRLNKFEFVTATLLVLGISTTFGFQLINPNIMTAYNSSSNIASALLLKDEIALSEVLKTLPSNKNWVATWYEPDPTSHRGSLISSSSFHLLRFEGAGENQSTLDFEEYSRRSGIRPICLVMLTSKSWKATTEFDRTEEYAKISSMVLPSNMTKLTIYCREIS